MVDSSAVARPRKGEVVDVLIQGEIENWAGTGTDFDTDQAMGDTPTLVIDLSPNNVKEFELTEVVYYLDPSGTITYQLYLLEGANADNLEQLSDIVFDSGATQAKTTRYQKAAPLADKLPKKVQLEEAGKLYFMVDYTVAPAANVPGFIKVRGKGLGLGKAA